MHRVHVVAIAIATALAFGCVGADDQKQEQAGSAAAASEQAAGVGAAGGDVANDQPLGEFEPLSDADVELYLKVLRGADARVRNMSEADRRTLETFRNYTEHPPATGQMPTAEQMAAIERAGDLMTPDAVTAREMGVSRRYGSIEHRADRYLNPMEGSSGEEHEEMTAEHRAWLQDRIRKFKELDRLDAGKLAPHRAELVELRGRVKFVVKAAGGVLR